MKECKICGSKEVYGFDICYNCYIGSIHPILHAEYQVEKSQENPLKVNKAPTNEC